MRLRREVARLWWTLVRIAGRRFALACAAGINTAVDLERRADRGLKPPAQPPLPAWLAAPLPSVPRPVARQRRPIYRISERERLLAQFAGTNGVGLFVVNADRAALIENAGRC